MSTRSNQLFKLDGTCVAASYYHWSGFPGGIGPGLLGGALSIVYKLEQENREISFAELSKEITAFADSNYELEGLSDVHMDIEYIWVADFRIRDDKSISVAVYYHKLKSFKNSEILEMWNFARENDVSKDERFVLYLPDSESR